jgi:hypothetical protein
MSAKLGERLSQADSLLASEMDKLAWLAIQKVDPVFVENYWQKLQAIPLTIDSGFVTQEALLAQSFDDRCHQLQMQGLVPDYFTLRNQAMENLGMHPTEGYLAL